MIVCDTARVKCLDLGRLFRLHLGRLFLYFAMRRWEKAQFYLNVNRGQELSLLLLKHIENFILRHIIRDFSVVAIVLTD